MSIVKFRSCILSTRNGAITASASRRIKAVSIVYSRAVRDRGTRLQSRGDRWIETGDILAGPPAVHEVLLQLAQESLDR